MGTLSAAVDGDGVMTVSGGPVRARCFGWVDVDQDDALILDGTARQSSSERGHRFEGRVELDGLRVAGAERFGPWTALLLPGGSRLLVEDHLALPDRNRVAARVREALAQPPSRHAAPVQQANDTARKVVGVVLALVLLDLFSR
jgi:hypothetical protein